MTTGKQNAPPLHSVDLLSSVTGYSLCTVCIWNTADFAYRAELLQWVFITSTSVMYRSLSVTETWWALSRIPPITAEACFLLPQWCSADSLGSVLSSPVLPCEDCSRCDPPLLSWSYLTTPPVIWGFFQVLLKQHLEITAAPDIWSCSFQTPI